MKQLKSLITLAVATVVGVGVIAAVVAEPREYERTIPNGYKLVKTNSETVAVFSPSNHGSNPSHAANGVAVAAKVDGIAVTGKWVVGHVIGSPLSELADHERVGFFVLDTDSGTVWAGLADLDFKAKCAEVGIRNVPALGKPWRMGNN